MKTRNERRQRVREAQAMAAVACFVGLVFLFGLAIGVSL